MKDYDTDNNGTIELLEFTHLIKSKRDQALFSSGDQASSAVMHVTAS